MAVEKSQRNARRARVRSLVATKELKTDDVLDPFLGLILLNFYK